MKNIFNYDSFLNESNLQNKYRDLFYNLLKKYKIKSLENLENKPELSKDFYEDLDKSWVKGKGLTDYGEDLFNIEPDKDYKKYFDKLLKKYNIESLEELKDKPKLSKDFYKDLDKGWLKDEGLTDYGKKILNDDKINESIIVFDDIEDDSDKERRYNKFIEKYNMLVGEYELGLGMYNDDLVILDVNNPDALKIIKNDDLTIGI